MSEVVYHFTNSARLPWIIETCELRPGLNRVGDYPNPDFLWATTNQLGDNTASGMSGGSYTAYRQGRDSARSLHPCHFGFY